MRRRVFILGVILLTTVGVVPHPRLLAAPIPLTFTEIRPPDAVSTYLGDINNAGHMVGGYEDGVGRNHGFLLIGDRFSIIDVPEASATSAQGINDQGHIVGWYSDALGRSHAFLLVDGTFSTIDFPGARDTYAMDVNNTDQVVGHFNDPGVFETRGFIMAAGKVSLIKVPKSSSVYPSGINNLGQVVGEFHGECEVVGSMRTCPGGARGFLLVDGQYTTLQFAGATSTFAQGINRLEHIVGYVLIDTKEQGYVFVSGSYSTVEFPQARSTLLRSINDTGQMVGMYSTSGVMLPGFLGRTRAFLATR